MKRNSPSPRMSIIVGAFSFICFGGLSIFLMNKDSSDSRQPLVKLSGIIEEVKTEGVGSKQDLLIQFEDDELWYRSPMSYPDKFTYRKKTKNRLNPGSKVIICLEESEHNKEPKKHRLKGYHWRKFVELHATNETHLSYEDHLVWVKNNDTIGRFLCPFLSLGGLYCLIHGIYRMSKHNKRQQTNL